jgi:hypothetical protein
MTGRGKKSELEHGLTDDVIKEQRENGQNGTET